MTADRRVRARAKAAGILADWQDYRGERHAVSIETLRALLGILRQPQGTATGPSLITARAGGRFRLPVEPGARSQCRLTLEGEAKSRRLETIASKAGATARAPTQPGYHRLTCGGRDLTLAVAPARSAQPPKTRHDSRHDWGLSVQLYSLYRPGDGGIGGYAALRDFVRSSGEAGAAAVAVSPLHAQFSADVEQFSPYSPSSRLWLNVLHIDTGEAAAAFGLAAPKSASGYRTGQGAPIGGTLIDWPEASRVKLKTLRSLFEAVRSRGLLEDGPLGRNFASFRRAGGNSLFAHALFETLHGHFYRGNSALWHWRDWPPEFRNPASAAARRFGRDHAEEIDFHLFLQWQAARQFRQASDVAVDAGMRIGLIKDIAVGADGGGSEAWSNQAGMLTGASIGAPPDEFNPLGQGWGVTTFAPAALTATGFVDFISLLRSALRDAGGIRIDHVLGLRRLWVVPDGAGPREGAYIRYPFDDLLRLTALEAHRAGALVLGEDLGTVPPGFRERLGGFGIRGMQVLWFQRQGKRFLPPRQWARRAVAMTTTHDLPTVAGWWTGKDVAWRRRLDLFAEPGGAVTSAAERKRDRQRLWQAFLRAGVAQGKPPSAGETGRVVAAAIGFLGRTACELVMLPLEDALGLKEQPNLPGTVAGHPNWRRRVLIPAGEICRQKGVARRLRDLAASRAKK